MVEINNSHHTGGRFNIRPHIGLRRSPLQSTFYRGSVETIVPAMFVTDHSRLHCSERNSVRWCVFLITHFLTEFAAFSKSQCHMYQGCISL